MKKRFLFIFTLVFLIISCQTKEKKEFLISKTQVGPLTKHIQVRQLDAVFENDSVVIKRQNNIFENGTEIIIYDRDGKKLLRLDPVQSFDSTSTIDNIQIIDPRFKTNSGFGIESTFKDIVTNYSISRIENTLNSIVVFIDEINAYVTIKKEELPGTLKGVTDQHIEVSKIPDTAKINYFWIDWQ